MRQLTIFFFTLACSDSAQILTPRDSGTPDVTTADVTADVSIPNDASSDSNDAADAGCPAGLERCNATCVDVSTYQTDAKNCGFCAHDCLGNTCTTGVCAPLLIGTNLPNPNTLAVNSTTVYFTTSGDFSSTGGSVYQCPVTGCPGKLGPMTTSLDNPNAIAIDAASVYWDNSADLTNNVGSVMSCPLADCGKAGASRKTIAKNLSFTQGIALDATNVYFGTWGATPYFGNGTVNSCPLAGCAGAPTSVMTGQSEPIVIALDATTLFMAPGGSAVPYIESGPIPGPSAGTRVFTAKVPNSIDGLAIFGGSIIFVDGGGGSVDTCTETSCATATQLVTGLSAPHSLAVDVSGIYWIDDTGIEMCPTSGCSTNKPILLATSTNALQNIAINGSFLYWVEQDMSGTAGQLLRVAR